MRRLATTARRIRPKLVERPLDDAQLGRLSELYREVPRGAMALHKPAEYLAWRYRDDPRTAYRAMVYRSRAGQGEGSFALVRTYVAPSGRSVLHVDDVWTREGSRRAIAKLYGELALLGLTESADVLRGFAIAGSVTEQALLSMSCIRKKLECRVMIRSLVPGLTFDRTPSQDLEFRAGDFSLYDP